MSFTNAVDIGNRACQHCGVPRIADFNEDSIQAGEIAFVYDKLRRAELRRNVWRFAIKHAALRPIDATTMMIRPSLWSASTTYGFGALVCDTSGAIWQSLTKDNLNNVPSAATAWDLYTGPTTVNPYDQTGKTGYYAGEIVYETPGDGTYSVYISMQSGNSQDPRAPSQWISTTRYMQDQVVLYYSAWAVGTTYAAGDVASYLAQDYISLAAANVGNTPAASLTKWALIPTALAPAYYDSTVTYAIGNFVTYAGINYVCILASTGNAPTNATYWAAQAVGATYVSAIDFNLNNDPSTTSFAMWNNITSYNAGASATGSDGIIYTSVTPGNLGNDPIRDNGTNWSTANVLNPWTTVNSFGNANTLWLQLSIALVALNIIYPIGAGPVRQSETRNVFMLPANFLRRAPQDPKAGSVSFMGAPTGLMYDDWNLEGNYIVSRQATAILLRFVADLTDVTKFDDMFCELLAARIALEIVQRVTNSDTKMNGISSMYVKFGTEARTVNGIETGPVEPPEDDYLTCRI